MSDLSPPRSAKARKLWRYAFTLAVMALLCGVLLGGLSAWFLGSVAIAGLTAAAYSFNFHVPAALVRLFAVGRTAARYAERLTGHHAALTPSDPVKLKVAGVGGVPADATAVEVNLTVASGTANSLITAYPDGATQPTVSNLNFSSGQAIANAAIVPIGADGDIDIVTPVGSNRMIVDVDGYFSANTGEAPSAYQPVTPYRYLDSRTIKNGALAAHYFYYLPFGQDWWGNVDPAVTGVVTNTTVTSVTAISGDLDVFPDNYVNGNLDVPTVSSLNFTKGATVPNLVFGTPGTDGDVDFLNNSAGSLQLVVDVFGVFQSS